MNNRLLLALSLFAGCGGSQTEQSDSQAGVVVRFSLDADLGKPDHFFDFPYPSDLRKTAHGAPDLTGFPNPGPVKAVEDLRPIALDRHDFPVIPVAYFAFTGALAPRSSSNVIAADTSSPILLVDVEPGAKERLHLYPLVAATPRSDAYMPDNLLEVAPRPGIVLHPGQRHAFVVLRSLNDSMGHPLGVASEVAALAGGKTPAGARAAAAVDSYSVLWKALDDLGVPREQVAAATVFTTADVVKENFELTTALIKQYSVTLSNLKMDPNENAIEDRFCELKGTVRYPQFQTGVPPFNTGGVFVHGADGLPMKQRDEDAPIVITIPRAPMPAQGYPLIVYFHGSGGLSTQVADFGRDVTPDMPEPGKGPAYYFAEKGIAAAASALPVNPERLPDASDTAYLNINNLSAFRDTFRQGIIEQRLFIEALRTLRIDPSLLAACPGASLPQGATTFQFNPDRLMAQGQSMGGMYTNLIGATEPRIKAVVPTGAGGDWSYFVFSTHAISGATPLLAALLGTDASALDFLHPTMMLFETGVEAVDPVVSMPRLARRPLDGHPVRPIYETCAKGDSYFDTTVYDAMALAYGNQEAGDPVWTTMQDALALEGDGGLAKFPVTQNRTSETGAKYTGVVVQYMADGPYDPHSIYRQLASVKHQYGCFYQSLLAGGSAVLPGPGEPGDPCP